MKIAKEDSPFKIGRFDLIGWSDPFPEQNKIMAKLLKFDTLVYARNLFTEESPPKCMFLPTNKLLEKMMKAFINYDDKSNKKLEPSIVDVLMKFGITEEEIMKLE